MRKSPRDRRLESDFAALNRLTQESSIFTFVAAGNPPQRYEMAFKGKGLFRSSSGHVGVAELHRVVVELGAAYPRMTPNLLWTTPIFHPNISSSGVVCLGGYGTNWVPSLSLDRLAEMLWDMIRYKNFDTESPFNRDAASWAKYQSDYRFPLDGRSLRDRKDVVGTQRAKSPQPPVKPVAKKETSSVRQPQNRRDTSFVISDVEIVERPKPKIDGIVFLD